MKRITLYIIFMQNLRKNYSDRDIHLRSKFFFFFFTSFAKRKLPAALLYRERCIRISYICGFRYGIIFTDEARAIETFVVSRNVFRANARTGTARRSDCVADFVNSGVEHVRARDICFKTKVNYIFEATRLSNKKRKRKILYERENCAAFCHRVRGYKFRDFVGGAISKTPRPFYSPRASRGVSFEVYTYFPHLFRPPAWTALVSTTILVQLDASHA